MGERKGWLKERKKGKKEGGAMVITHRNVGDGALVH